MNDTFKHLLDFMIPQLVDGISGSYVWQSSFTEMKLEERFSVLLKSNIQEPLIESPTLSMGKSGCFVYDFVETKEPSLLLEIGNALIELWFTNPEVLEAYQLTSGALFPAGRNLSPTDWSILEPVYLRGKVYRE